MLRPVQAALPYLHGAALTAAAALAAYAGSRSGEPEAGSPAAAAGPRWSAGETVMKDPGSRGFRTPTPEEWRAMESEVKQLMRRRVDQLPPVEVRADGTLRQRLGRSFLSASVGRVDGQGELSVSCGVLPTHHETDGHQHAVPQ